MSNIALGLLGLFAFVVYRYKKSTNRNSGLSLPPGPRKLPFIGTALEMPREREWETYHRWCKELHTDIIHLDVVGTSIVVLDTAEAATELLDKRSAIYSDRPRMVMVNELMGWDFVFGLMHYGDEWRCQRRLFQQEFHPAQAERFQPVELSASHELLRRILDDPENFVSHIRHLAGATIMRIAYGLDVLPSNDPFIAAAEAGLTTLAKACVPGAFLVDAFPILKHVPEWLPGAGFKRKAKEWREYAHIMRRMPFEAAKRNIAISKPSFITYSLEQLDESRDVSEQEHFIQSAAATMFTGATDSTVSVLCTFILAMLANPASQKRAQEELDRVLSPGELPRFSDKDSLPFIDACVKETLRWQPVTPMSIPHALTEDDVYQGYRIPAGTIVIPNLWAMLYNEAEYPDPYSFRPERFIKDGKLDPEVKDPALYLFGHGRRICPGRHMAYSSVWIAIASLLSVFEISKATDGDGNPVEPSYEYVSSLAWVPRPFKCSLKPRSKGAVDMIRSTL
ncbi:cytochrome P450 [Mycena floridula]|nr:cytochrome P450 [Mycena floridula]